MRARYLLMSTVAAMLLFGVFSFLGAYDDQRVAVVESAFKDVSIDHPHVEAINYVKSKGIVKGYEDGTFKPDAKINRAEFMKIVVEAVVGQEPLEHAGQCFTDVASGVWFYSYICYAERVGMVGGYPDGSFKPSDAINFVEGAKIIVNGFNNGVKVPEDEIWYRPFVKDLEGKKAIPYAVMAFDAELTRGQMAEMIYRIHGKVIDRPSHTYESLEKGDSPADNMESNKITTGGGVGLSEVAQGKTVAVGANVVITEDEEYRYIKSDGIPNHETGEFPNKGNPNTISAQDYEYRVPLSPKKAAAISESGLPIAFGVAVNGVPFDPGAAEFWNNDRDSGWQYEALSGAIDLGLDENNAHVQPNGAYHYHGLPTGLNGYSNADEHSALIGYAADGFPIYAVYGFKEANNSASGVKEMKSSYSLKTGTRDGGPGGSYDGTFVADYEFKEGAGDLDQCNGRDGVTPEYPEGTYHYFLTNDYPFIPRCFVGTPDDSFSKGGGGGPGGPGGPPPRR